MDNDLVHLVRRLRVTKPRRRDVAPDVADAWNALRADDRAALTRTHQIPPRREPEEPPLRPEEETVASLQEAAWASLVRDERKQVETARRRLRGMRTAAPPRDVK